MSFRRRSKTYSAIPESVDQGLLGHGGTAEVRRVLLPDDTVAALKIPITHTEEFCNLAQREWTLIGGKNIPSVVRLLAPPQDGRLLLEICNGPTLDNYRGKLSLSHTLEIISAAAAALELIHAHGIIHADLKSQNIFLPAEPSDQLFEHLWFPKYSDFALGRLTSEPESSRAGHGTVGFVAPELLNHHLSSRGSDLFAFGVMAYELLTGVHPFLQGSTDPMIVAARVCEGEIPLPSTIRSQITSAIDALVLSLLDRDTSSRLPHAVHVCEQLEALGCRYPFRWALNPRWFPADAQAFAPTNEQEAVDHRLLHTASWRAGHVVYAGEKFSLQRQIRVPARLRSRLLARAFCTSLKSTRVAIDQAVWSSATMPITQLTSDLKMLQAQLLLQTLRASTIKARALRLYEREQVSSEKSNTPPFVARLALMAGLYNEAARLGSDSSIELTHNGKGVEAIQLLRFLRDELRGAGEIALARNLTFELGSALRSAGTFSEAEPELLSVISPTNSEMADKLDAEAHSALGILYHKQDKFFEGKEHLDRCLALYQKFGNELAVSKTYNNLGNLHWLVSDYATSLILYRKALALQRKLGAEPEVASTMNNAGTVYCMLGRFDRAIRLFRQSLERNKHLGIQTEIARTLNNLGFVYHTTGRGDEAVGVLTESLALNRHMGNQKEILYNLENLASELITSGRLSEGEKTISDGRNLSIELSDQPHLALFDLKQATIHRRRGHFDLAANMIAQAEPIALELDNKTNLRTLMYERAKLLASTGHHAEAQQLAEQLLGEAQAASDETNSIQAVLLLSGYTCDEKIDALAQQLLAGPFTLRERALHAYARLECALAGDDTASIESEIERSAEYPHVSGLESLACALTLAEALYRLGRIEACFKLLMRPPQTTDIAELLPERVRLNVLLAEVSMRREDFDVAYRAIRKAIQDSAEMLGRLSPEDAELQQSSPVYQRMSELVLAIKSRLQKKKRTG